MILGLTSKYLTEAKEYCYSTVNDFFQKAALEYSTQSAVSLDLQNHFKMYVKLPLTES